MTYRSTMWTDASYQNNTGSILQPCQILETYSYNFSPKSQLGLKILRHFLLNIV